jgi:cardiolipin synthase C
VMFYAADAEVITDDPDKLLNKVSMDQKILVTRMAEVIASAESEVIVINPYFIPRQTGLDFWESVVNKGVQVTVLTNSLASTNHVAVHSSYSGYRKRLLEVGVELHEARANATPVDPEIGEKLESLTLHTKLVAVDRRYLFVGSLNLDPRAIDINTEMGVLIDAPEMVGPMVERFRARLPEFSYKLKQDDKGRLEWHGLVDGTPVVETSEPLASGWLRFNAWFQKILPEGQL